MFSHVDEIYCNKLMKYNVNRTNEYIVNRLMSILQLIDEHIATKLMNILLAN